MAGREGLSPRGEETNTASNAFYEILSLLDIKKQDIPFDLLNRENLSPAEKADVQRFVLAFRDKILNKLASSITPGKEFAILDYEAFVIKDVKYTWKQFFEAFPKELMLLREGLRRRVEISGNNHNREVHYESLNIDPVGVGKAFGDFDSGSGSNNAPYVFKTGATLKASGAALEPDVGLADFYGTRVFIDFQAKPSVGGVTFSSQELQSKPNSSERVVRETIIAHELLLGEAIALCENGIYLLLTPKKAFLQRSSTGLFQNANNEKDLEIFPVESHSDTERNRVYGWIKEHAKLKTNLTESQIDFCFNQALKKADWGLVFAHLDLSTQAKQGATKLRNFAEWAMRNAQKALRQAGEELIFERFPFLVLDYDELLPVKIRKDVDITTVINDVNVRTELLDAMSVSDGYLPWAQARKYFKPWMIDFAEVPGEPDNMYNFHYARGTDAYSRLYGKEKIMVSPREVAKLVYTDIAKITGIKELSKIPELIRISVSRLRKDFQNVHESLFKTNQYAAQYVIDGLGPLWKVYAPMMFRDQLPDLFYKAPIVFGGGLKWVNPYVLKEFYSKHPDARKEVGLEDDVGPGKSVNVPFWKEGDFVRPNRVIVGAIEEYKKASRDIQGGDREKLLKQAEDRAKSITKLEILRSVWLNAIFAQFRPKKPDSYADVQGSVETITGQVALSEFELKAFIEWITDFLVSQYSGGSNQLLPSEQDIRIIARSHRITGKRKCRIVDAKLSDKGAFEEIKKTNGRYVQEIIEAEAKAGQRATEIHTKTLFGVAGGTTEQKEHSK